MSNRPDALPPELEELHTGIQTRTAGSNVAAPPVEPLEQPAQNEEISRIRVDPEDRLAFRVGVNILTLVLIGIGAWLVWRNFFAGN